MNSDKHRDREMTLKTSAEARITRARLRIAIMASLLALGLGAVPMTKAQTLTTLYSFGGSLSGQGPLDQGGVLVNYNGNLYGTACCKGSGDYGNVFELSNSSGKTIENVIHAFGGPPTDGSYPYTGLIADSSGNLYGTTSVGGTVNEEYCEYGCGTVFELLNASGTYTYRVLYNFSAAAPSGGYYPSGPLLIDSSGNLYGMTSSGGQSAAFTGVVFELAYSSGTYSEKVLYAFPLGGSGGAFPSGGLIMDSSGNLFGTTSCLGGTCNGYAGTVFELVNSSGTYTPSVLHTFTGGSADGATPYAGLVMDSSGNLYGTTANGGNSNCTGGCGTVFELVNSSGTYTENVLYNFPGAESEDGANPYAGLLLDSLGNLYGTTVNGGANNLGAIFKLSPNSPGSYSESVLYSFTGADGAQPSAGLIMDASGNLYGATTSGGALGYGTVFELSQTSQSNSGFAVTNGNNTFTGNQTVNGTLTATTLDGNGSGLTNLNTADLSAGTAGINVSGNASTASVAGALAGPTTQCGTNMFAIGIAANGNANCSQPASTNLSDHSSLVFNNQGNIFTGGKLTLSPSTAGYASLNVPNSGPIPTVAARGDLWLTTADTHLKFLDNTNTTQSLAFLSDVTGEGSTLLGSNNIFTGSNTFSQIINGNISGNAATATSATTASTATSALTATTASSAATAGALAATPTQCGANMFATGIAANGNANCAQPSSTSQILFSSSGIPVWNGAYLGVAAPNLLESSIQQITAVGGLITGMQCYSQVAPKSSSLTFTVRINGASSTAVCTVAAGSTKGSVTGLNISFAVGNLLDILVTGNTLAAASVAVGIAP
jgi:uncharacterized repeat protein (TIGR03803 family)